MKLTYTDPLYTVQLQTRRENRHAQLHKVHTSAHMLLTTTIMLQNFSISHLLKWRSEITEALLKTKNR